MPTRVFIVAAAAMFLNGAVLCVAKPIWTQTALRPLDAFPIPRWLSFPNLNRLSFAIPLALGFVVGFLLSHLRHRNAQFVFFLGWWLVAVVGMTFPSEGLPPFLQTVPLTMIVGVLGAGLVLIPHWAQGSFPFRQAQAGTLFILLAFGALGGFAAVLGLPLVRGSYDIPWEFASNPASLMVGLGLTGAVTLVHLDLCWNSGEKAYPENPTNLAAPTWYQRIRWVFLAAVPSAFILASWEVWGSPYSEDAYRMLAASLWLGSITISFARLYSGAIMPLTASIVVQGSVLILLPTVWATHAKMGLFEASIAPWVLAEALCLLPHHTTWLTQPIFTGLALMASYESGSYLPTLLATLGAYWVLCRGCHGDMIVRPYPGWLREISLSLALGYLLAAIVISGIRLATPITPLHMQMILVCGFIVRILPSGEATGPANSGG